jgi:hypothetical protein
MGRERGERFKSSSQWLAARRGYHGGALVSAGEFALGISAYASVIETFAKGRPSIVAPARRR